MTNDTNDRSESATDVSQLNISENILRDAQRYRKIIAASEMEFPLLSVCDDPENDAIHRYGRQRIDFLVDSLDLVEPIMRENDIQMPSIEEINAAAMALERVAKVFEGSARACATNSTLWAQGETYEQAAVMARRLKPRTTPGVLNDQVVLATGPLPFAID